ncbi:hypothetical protein EDB55_0411 [Vibrio crassostreae]|uniref:hypothetical protein n=1 Tax=Vibrio crassostreae TaxID=246167 RepID=UPI000FB8A266|nr:hypothetical protein [Vibrio crassostreae]ROR85741.1 hypothetical protein EDB55_0411 [Vibrio crassostreae]
MISKLPIQISSLMGREDLFVNNVANDTTTLVSQKMLDILNADKGELLSTLVTKKVCE